MTDRLAELGALQYAVENLSTAGTSPNRLALAGYIHAAYTDYQAWAAANPGVNPDRLSARGRLYGYFYDNASWSPSELFASSEVGAWYDPSDLTTMFQDRAGTTPVTADGQPVGLVLDKSKGLTLGSELVTNGDFSSGFETGWAVWTGWNIVDGKASSDGSGNNIVQYPTGYNGKFVKITFDVTVSSGVVYFRPSYGNTTNQQAITSSGTKSLSVLTVSGGFEFFTSAGATGVTVDNVSIKELPGNHAVAPSDAARPLKTSTGLSKWINYDAVDDALNSTFSSSLGSSCTVARANVGSSPTILTSQTIGTSYADSTDHAGLIIINRALTGQETTDVTAWLTAKGATA